MKLFLKFVPPDDRLRPVVAEVAWLDLMAHRNVSIDEEGDAVSKVDLLPGWDLDCGTPGAMFAEMYGIWSTKRHEFWTFST